MQVSVVGEEIGMRVATEINAFLRFPEDHLEPQKCLFKVLEEQ